MMAKTKILPNPVTQLPTTSGIIDAVLFNQVHDLILTTGKEDGDAYVLETDRLIIHTDFKPTANEAIMLILDKSTLISRVYGCRGLQEDMRECMEHSLYHNTLMFLGCRVPEEFMDEMLKEIECECFFLPTEKKREIAFKARDEIGPEKIQEMFLRALQAGRKVA